MRAPKLQTKRIKALRNLRQIGGAHQVSVAFPRSAAAFLEGPDYQALAPAAVAGGEVLCSGTAKHRISDVKKFDWNKSGSESIRHHQGKGLIAVLAINLEMRIDG